MRIGGGRGKIEGTIACFDVPKVFFIIIGSKEFYFISK